MSTTVEVSVRLDHSAAATNGVVLGVPISTSQHVMDCGVSRCNVRISHVPYAMAVTDASVRGMSGGTFTCSSRTCIASLLTETSRVAIFISGNELTVSEARAIGSVWLLTHSV